MKPSRLQMILDIAFRNVGDPMSVKGSRYHLTVGIQGELTLDSDPDLLSVLLEFPGVKTADAVKASTNTVVTHQLLRRQRYGAGFEVCWRADRHQPPVGANAHCYHVLLEAFAKSDTSIEPVFDNVAEAAIDAEFELDVGIIGKDGRHFPLRGWKA